ncbi:MAG: hypothetical protein QOJ12_875, partial [Thermoleophilales bacterium]|nr:hypothetical protein [Thermoleophilales bacterium]
MRRAISALVVTVVVVLLLVNFKAQPALTISGTPKPRPAAATPKSSGSTSTSASTTPKTTPAKPKTFVGPAVDNQYGTVQVAVTVLGNQIKDVQALRMPSGDGRTNDISFQAAPLLKQEVLNVQSGQIDTISGASYTSDSY